MMLLAEKIVRIVSDESMVIQRANTPVQSDFYSCVFFVCYKIWRQVDHPRAAIYPHPVSSAFVLSCSSS
jgi:hypothetical protein